ncbi:MAG: hypothetical protein U5O15_02615 [Candidatus Krumholzibacteriota bacterium]|nr:hypothetical protein [Candidatus Krumholzibacteriota bacterium]
MKVALRGLLTLFIIFVVTTAPGALRADPCLVVYPDISCIYYYDSSEYYTVGPGDSLYDSEYDRGGEVLLEVGSGEIDLSIYQAPGLSGFEPSSGENEGFVFSNTAFTLYLDGFSNEPTTYQNILVKFDDILPEGCSPLITVDGQVLAGNEYNAGDLVVSTPTEEGNNYSDTIALDINWSGCEGIHIWAFSDEDYNGIRDGGECFTAYSHDVQIPSEKSTWGALKSDYK